MSRRRNVGKIKVEFCIACSRGHSAGYFGTKIRCLAKLFYGVIANSVVQNMHHGKLNLLSKLMSKSYIQLQSTINT